MGHKKKVYIDPKTLNLPLVGCDSHAHIVTPPLWEERDEVLLRAKEAGVRTIGEVLLGHKQYIEHKDYFDDKEHVFFIYGLHPTDLLEIDAGETERIYEDIMRDKKEKRKIRAVGEIGLDYYWKEVPHALQQEYFIKMLALAKQCALPVVIHSRDAFEDTVNILLEQGFHDYPLLWHCFDRDRECAEIVLSHGWHISVPGSVTYKANAHVREALKIIDRERLLLETDSPYLSPEPWRGKPDEPAFTVFTAECVAKELEVGTAELWEQCGNNARRFFGVE